ncbi:hypothetical protein ACLOJK_039364 [Asimina triloba]
MHQQERRVRPQLAAEQLQQQQQQQPQKCPRCDSLNTKFCYYNNYSLSQPRYFCKTCRRYWTQGGTLRNVPVGGGCRKGKRSKKPSSSSSSALSYTSATAAASADSGFHHSLLLPPQPPQQDSILVATSAVSASPLRNATDAIAATASGCSSTSPSASLPYYSAGGGGFFSSLIAMQSYNHAMNAADFAGLSSPPPAQATTSAPFNHPLLTGFNMPLHHQQQRIPPQPAAGFQMGGDAVDRPLQQLFIPTQPSRSSAGAPPASFQHQEWPPHTIAPDGGYWQSNVGSSGAGGPPSSGGHWPDLPGFGPSSSSPSYYPYQCIPSGVNFGK